ncbi:MAG: glycine cleavage system protein H [Syntrophobacter sp.]
MRQKPFFQRQCRHMLSGRVQYKFCANNYQCNVCEFDQDLDEEDLSGAVEGIFASKIAGFVMADNYYYSRGHGWARVENGGFIRMGIDDFTLRLLGSPTEVRLPNIGQRLEQNAPGWTFLRKEKGAAMISPMKGVVVATNQKILRDPSLVKKEPYGLGWLIVIEPRAMKKNIRNLLFETTAIKWLRSEATRLEEMVHALYGVSLAATGGEIVDDIVSNLPHLEWEDLVHEFLLT